MKEETIYELLQDYSDPNGNVSKGVRKTEKQWMARFALMNDGDCQRKPDWFKNVTEPSCSRCGKYIPDNWEVQMCNGYIKTDISCQSIMTLWGKDEPKIGFKHPALLNQDYQKLEIGWGYNEKCRLCWHCHREFIQYIGNWLKLIIK